MNSGGPADTKVQRDLAYFWISVSETRVTGLVQVRLQAHVTKILPRHERLLRPAQREARSVAWIPDAACCVLDRPAIFLARPAMAYDV